MRFICYHRGRKHHALNINMLPYFCFVLVLCTVPPQSLYTYGPTTMFGSKFTGRVKDSLTQYLDEKFEDYRGQVALDLSKGLAVLAGLIAILSIAIVSVIFSVATLAILLGWLLSLVWTGPAYLVSFLFVTGILFGVAYFLIKNKKHYIEEPVFKIVAKALRSPSTDAAPEVATVSEVEANIADDNPPIEHAPSFAKDTPKNSLETND